MGDRRKRNDKLKKVLQVGDHTGGCYGETLACRKQETEKIGVGEIEMSVMAMPTCWQRGTGLYIAKAPIGRPPSVGQPAESSILTAPMGRPAPAFILEPSSSPCNRAQSTPPSDLTVRGRHEVHVSTRFCHATRLRGGGTYGGD